MGMEWICFTIQIQIKLFTTAVVKIIFPTIYSPFFTSFLCSFRKFSAKDFPPSANLTPNYYVTWSISPTLKYYVISRGHMMRHLNKSCANMEDVCTHASTRIMFTIVWKFAKRSTERRWGTRNHGDNKICNHDNKSVPMPQQL